MTLVNLMLARVAGFVALLCIACSGNWAIADDNQTWYAGNLALSNDGRHLAVVYVLEYDGEGFREYDIELWLYDLEQPLTPPRFVLQGHAGGEEIEFSPDSTLLAIGSYLELRVYDVATLAPVLELTNSKAETPADFRWIYFSPDSQYIMAFTDWWARDLDMHVWKIDTGDASVARRCRAGPARDRASLAQPGLAAILSVALGSRQTSQSFTNSIRNQA